MTIQRPNILVIYTDQQRFDTLGANGNHLIQTPNLDRLAAEGMNFTRAYTTCPICVPSRVGFFTGRYAHANHSWSNQHLMAEDEVDLVSSLKERGYTTALIGKNHCFPASRLPQTFDTVEQAGHLGFHHPRTEAQRRVNEMRASQMYAPVAEVPLTPEEDITGHLFRRARAYLAQTRDNPFFLWLSIPDPHPPYMVCEPYASMYDDVDLPLPVWREGEMANKPYRQQCVVAWDALGRDYPTEEDQRRLKAIYWGMVSYIDTEVGGLMAALREQDLEEETIVVFTTDHGDYMGNHRMIRKGPHLYEDLTHIPQMIAWQGHIDPGVTGALTANIDVMPTLLDLAGVPLPDGPPALHGRSFKPLLLGESAAHREHVFMEHGEPGPVITPETFSAETYRELGATTRHHLAPEIRRGRVKGVRGDQWKFCTTPGDVDELYDLMQDPHELRNLADDPAYADVVCKLRHYLCDWLIETEDTRGT
jgi:arylsulfatase A-like enzyme